MPKLVMKQTSAWIVLCVLQLSTPQVALAEDDPSQQLKQLGVYPRRDRAVKGRVIVTGPPHEGGVEGWKDDDLLRAIPLLAKLDRDVRLELELTAITDKSVRELPRMKNLTSLVLNATEITDRSFEAIGRITNLQEVFSAGCAHLRGDGLKHLGNLRSLKKLSLAGTFIDDQHGTELGNCKSLVELYLGATDIGDETLRMLIKCDSLEVLDVGGTAVSAKGLSALVQLPKLRKVNLSADGIGDDCIPSLVQMKQLRELRIVGTAVTESGIKDLRAKLPNLAVEK